MKNKRLSIVAAAFLLTSLIIPVAAADPSASVILPGWVGGGLAALSILLPLSLFIWLRQRGQA